MADDKSQDPKEELNELDDAWADAFSESQENETGAVEEPEVHHAQFENFAGAAGSVASPDASTRKLGMLLDVMLPVTIELGRTQMYIKKILDLERGSIVELDKMAGEPVDLYINNKKMAEGEVVVVDKHFGVRITNLIDPADRIKNLGNP
ncbi:MAG: flagellar motor switch protein FliN [Calditrichia bacterium]|nr:flagellar motor switch protein FliN [Calditrichota bacterium]MCB0270260.1 flagellar motor switch protein FliN [Calditrichota bacterium]MCB9068354.1 flagellar motor switch protein FliN [Calditrichia bacterium]